MSWAQFYGRFAAAYGTFWLVMLVAAVVSQSHIDAGEFGLYGFPLMALAYAVIRQVSDGSRGASAESGELAQLRRRVARLERDGPED